MKKVRRMEEIVEPLLDWYHKNKRDLPWRKDKNPYHIWISEIMLQQTRVEAVKNYYRVFMETLPTIKDLKEVEEDTLLKLWEGLGYYSRARNLKKAALEIVEKYNGKFPEEYEELRKLPGIGPYTAGAISSIAFDKKVPAIDGNVIRVMLRLKNSRRRVDDSKLKEELFQELIEIMPEESGDLNQAFMDLGATICIPNTYPICSNCPLQKYCKAYLEHNTLNIPVPKEQKQKTTEKYTIVILMYQEKIAIRKRPASGILASLYEFLTIEGEYTLPKLRAFLINQEIKIKKMKRLGPSKHVFTHKIWEMKGYLVELEEMIPDFCWIEKDELLTKYSIPTAFSYYKDKLKEH